MQPPVFLFYRFHEFPAFELFGTPQVLSGEREVGFLSDSSRHVKQVHHWRVEERQHVLRRFFMEQRPKLRLQTYSRRRWSYRLAVLLVHLFLRSLTVYWGTCGCLSSITQRHLVNRLPTPGSRSPLSTLLVSRAIYFVSWADNSENVIVIDEKLLILCFRRVCKPSAWFPEDWDINVCDE